jgi:serine/threonine protein kinase
MGRMATRLPSAAQTPAGPDLASKSAIDEMSAIGSKIGGRYQILGELGRGGMARVYRVLDSQSGAEVALKQLTGSNDPKRAHLAAALFEREFHTLTQLSHPRVIRVYDFAIDPAGPYYTMELLDGGDLRERTPLPWRDACELIFDVCSSLALLHSRRLVHRDVSPRNVRCTRDGHAKLIDFGAMVQMGPSGELVGTAPFVAPEVLHASTLDGRTDLFSLGNTLYFTLTGRLAFPARDFPQLLEVWSDKPAPPSAFVPEIPAALDQLVLSLISLEPALRPRSAFEVMQRLATVAKIHREEPLSVSSAYLITPSLVGRDAELATFRASLDKARQGRGQALLFQGPSGSGRSRMLDACVLEAKMFGARVLRSSRAAHSGEDFATAHALASQLFEADR